MNRLSEYQRDLEALRFTEEQKQDLVRRTLQAAGQRSQPVRRRPVLRTGLIAAALAAVLAVGAGASGVLRPVTEVFAPVFGGSAAQTEIIGKIGYPIGASDTDNGVTITADAIIGDAYNACVVFTITREDGEVFDYQGNEYGYMPLLFNNDSLDLGVWGGSHGSRYFIDQTPGDNTIQCVVTRTSDVPLRRGTARAVFEDLCVWEDTQKPTPLVKGKWDLKFDMDYEDASVTLGGGETFQQSGMTFTVDEITVSPVAVRVAYTVDSAAQWSDAPSGRQSDADRQTMQRYFDDVEILLTKTDGTVLDMSNSGGSISPEDGVTRCTKGRILEQIIPLEELESISVGGVVYDIPVQ